ncbi:MAG: 50S ribosomal protein L32 [Candidatus Babeliaceae bacterium]
MPVPKRKTSKSRRDQRSASKHIKPQAITGCTNCKEPLMPHQVCESCGFYKGRKVLITKKERALRRGQTQQVMAAKRAQREETEQDNQENR